MQECIYHVQTHISPCTVCTHGTLYSVLHIHTTSLVYMLLCDTGSTCKKYICVTTYCARRVVGGLAMRNLKIESRETMIAVDLMYTQAHYIFMYQYG